MCETHATSFASLIPDEELLPIIPSKNFISLVGYLEEFQIQLDQRSYGALRALWGCTDESLPVDSREEICKQILNEAMMHCGDESSSVFVVALQIARGELNFD